MRQNTLAPSILAADCAVLGEQIKAVEAGGAGFVHIDVMDGVFVPSLSFGLPIVKAARASTKLFLDVHLMIIHPLKYVRNFADAGADGITFHYESEDDPKEVIQAIRDAGCKVGMSICPETPIEEIYGLLPLVDMLLIMTVHPGFGGQEYIRESTMRVAQARAHIDSEHLDCDIEVDGGMTEEVTRMVLEVGANVIVAGSAIFGSDPEGSCRRYMDILDHTRKGEVL